MSDQRRCTKNRETLETRVYVNVDIDGRGDCRVTTPYEFVNHLITQFGIYSAVDLTVEAQGDLMHHVVEDVGIVIGQAIGDALGTRDQIQRYGWAAIPMDASLSLVAIDLTRRPYFMIRGLKATSKEESQEVHLIPHLLRSLTYNVPLCLHVNILYQDDTHHALEAAFKALGVAFRQASRKWEGGPPVPSSKGAL